MANNIYDHPALTGRQHGGGEPPDMEQRLRHLETDMAIIKETIATKSALAETETRIIKWNVGTIIAVAALAFTIAKFLN